MSRPPRYTYAHAVHHVTMRCNNREFLFAAPWFQLFLGVLREARAKFPLDLYNYCLMTNHVHLLFEVGHGDTLSKAMRWLSTEFARRFNKRAGRKGHLWEGRFRSTIVEENSYFFRCMAYVDLNPVRAGIALVPMEYPWGGHRALRDEDSELLHFHPLYTELGTDPSARFAAYERILAEEAARPAISLANEYFVGTRSFVRRMERRFGLNRQGAFVRHVDLGSGVLCSGPRLGRSGRSK